MTSPGLVLLLPPPGACITAQPGARAAVKSVRGTSRHPARAGGQAAGPYDGADSSACFAHFQTRYRGDRDASALRGALFQCQDAGFLNTGVGLGHNTYANPFVCRPADRQSVRERYTGREFILPNALFTALPSHIAIPLDLGTPGHRDTGTPGLPPHRILQVTEPTARRRSAATPPGSGRSAPPPPDGPLAEGCRVPARPGAAGGLLHSFRNTGSSFVSDQARNESCWSPPIWTRAISSNPASA